MGHAHTLLRGFALKISYDKYSKRLVMSDTVSFLSGRTCSVPPDRITWAEGSQAGYHSWLDLCWVALVTHHHKITLWGQQQEHWNSVGFMLLAKVLGNFKSKCIYGNNLKAVCELPYCPISNRSLEFFTILQKTTTNEILWTTGASGECKWQ